MLRESGRLKQRLRWDPRIDIKERTYFFNSSMVNQAKRRSGGTILIISWSIRSSPPITVKAALFPKTCTGAANTDSRKCSRWEHVRNHFLALWMSAKDNGLSSAV